MAHLPTLTNSEQLQPVNMKYYVLKTSYLGRIKLYTVWAEHTLRSAALRAADVLTLEPCQLAQGETRRPSYRVCAANRLPLWALNILNPKH